MLTRLVVVAEHVRREEAHSVRRPDQSGVVAAHERTAATGGSQSASNATTTFSVSPYHSGIAVCGPMVMPAASSRATVGASGSPVPPPTCHRWHRRQRFPIRAQELELAGGIGDHLKPNLVHRAVVEAAQADQIGEPRLPAVGPMFDVVGVAMARATTGELTLISIPTLQGAAQRGWDRARLAPDVEHFAVVAVGAMIQHHQPGIAGDATRHLRADVQPPCLLDHRLTSVESGRRCRCRYGGFRSRRVVGARFRGNARGGSDDLAGAKGIRVHVHRYLVAITRICWIESASQSALSQQPQCIRAPLPDV